MCSEAILLDQTSSQYSSLVSLKWSPSNISRGTHDAKNSGKWQMNPNDIILVGVLLDDPAAGLWKSHPSSRVCCNAKIRTCSTVPFNHSPAVESLETRPASHPNLRSFHPRLYGGDLKASGWICHVAQAFLRRQEQPFPDNKYSIQEGKRG